MKFAKSLYTTLSAVSILMLAASVPASALTPPVLTISESLGETVTIDSGGSITFGGTCTPTTCGTSNGGLVFSAGSIAWSGYLHGASGENIQFFNFQGLSKPALTAPQMSLGGRINNFTREPVTFTIKWSDTGFGPGESPATMTAAGGTAPLNLNTPGIGMITNVTFSAYVDTTNTLNGTQTPVNNINFPDLTVEQSSSAVGPGPTLDPFSMTEMERFTMSGMPTGQPQQMASYFFSNFMLSASPYPPLTLACPVASGQAGFPYASFLSASGGVPPYIYSITSGSLPAGLTLDPSSGAIQGTPQTAGAYPFTAQVMDSSGTTANTATSSCGLAITMPPAPPTLACSAATGLVNTPYSSNLVATNGTPPYTFSIVSGSLPTGLFLNSSTGAIAGTPTAAGNDGFTAQVVDSSGDSESSTVTQACGINVYPSVTSTCVTINAIQGVAVTPVQMNASGGTGAGYTFSATGLPGGLTMASDGTISGTPTVSGTFNYTVTITDSAGNTGTVNCSVTVAPPVTGNCVVITAEQGVAITPVQMNASGGTGTGYTFSAVGLPAGLTMAANGTISGTPTVSGTFNYTVTITDSAGNTGTVNCSLTVTPPPTVACSSVTSGEVGVAFNSPAMTVTGGTAPFTFSVATGTIPAGLTLNASTGAITGTPTAAGTFTIQVKDVNGVVATGTCPFTIMAPPTVACSAINSGEVGVAFNSPAMTVTGGTAPFTFSVATGTLPAGLTLNASTGAITGTPTSSGTFTIQVTDANGVVATGVCPFTIAAAPSVACSATNSGEVGVAFNSPAMTITGGTAPFTFSVATGPLPAGLTLNASTGAITGTPTAAGTFTIKVTDSRGAVAAGTCPFTIAAAPSVACPAINSGEVGIAFNSPAMTITGGSAPYTFSIASGILPAGLTLNTTTGAITGVPTAAGSFTIKVTDAKGALATGTCPFTIVAGVSVGCSTVTSGQIGAPFSSPALTVSGGSAPYTFSVATGTLPPGLTLNTATGAVTGTPTAAGTFTLEVTDAAGSVGVDTCAFTVTGLPSCSATLGPLSYNVNNESSVSAGEIVWFNSHLSKLGGTIPTSDFQIFVQNGKITFGISTLSVPNAVITFTSTVGCASTTFDTATNTWQTTLPLSAANSADEIFAAGLAYPLPANFAQNVKNVIWSATVYSTAPALQVSWQYGVSNWLTQHNGTSFPVLAGGQPDYNGMMIDPAHNAPLCNPAYNTGDHAGAPEFAGRSNVLTGGGSGGGGSNWTGSWSSTPAATGFNCGTGPVGTGDAATMGFWHNKNGQALILSINGGSGSEALANWLATQFPYLYGAKSSNNLTNKTNADVAALFLTFFGQSGQKTSAQIMSGALASYVTNSTLAGTTAVQYGFNSSSGGTGSKTYNVGTYGSAIGLVNNQSYTVLQLLQQANLTQGNGTFNANAFNTIFNGVNTTGDITN